MRFCPYWIPWNEMEGDMAERKGTRTVLLVLNTVGLIGTLVVNALANILPLNGRNTGEISDSIPNLFVPSGSTFAVWGVIYVLLVVALVYQMMHLKKFGQPDPIESLGLWFFISCLANGAWIFTWHWQLLELSLLVMLILLVTLIVMHTKVRRFDTPLGFRVGIMLPISVYLGWITVATIANVTALAVVSDWGRFGLSEVFWTVSVMVVAILINLLAIIIRGDIWFAFVGAWALYGIYSKRSAEQVEPVPMVIWTALVGVILILLVILIHLVVKGKRVARGEG